MKDKFYEDNIYGTDDTEYGLTKHRNFANQNTNRTKSSFAKDIERFGNDYIEDVTVKENRKEKKHQEKIKYILKYSKDQFGDKDVLINTSFQDIESIYIQVKELKKPWYKTLLEFIMNWDYDKQ